MPPLPTNDHEFVGTDINPAPFPQSIPPNVTFIVQDINKPWPSSQNGQFDLVHQRLAFIGAGPNPSAAVSHLYSVLKPGGWIQISEGTMDFPADIVNKERTPAYSDMLQVMQSIAGVVGVEWHLGNILKGLLEEAGFTDIAEEDVTLNLGRTNKDENLAKEGVESCVIAVENLSNFAKSKHSASLYPFSGNLCWPLGCNLSDNYIYRISTRETDAAS